MYPVRLPGPVSIYFEHVSRLTISGKSSKTVSTSDMSNVSDKGHQLYYQERNSSTSDASWFAAVSTHQGIAQSCQKTTSTDYLSSICLHTHTHAHTDRHRTHGVSPTSNRWSRWPQTQHLVSNTGRTMPEGCFISHFASAHLIHSMYPKTRP